MIPKGSLLDKTHELQGSTIIVSTGSSLVGEHEQDGPNSQTTLGCLLYTYFATLSKHNSIPLVPILLFISNYKRASWAIFKVLTRLLHPCSSGANLSLGSYINKILVFHKNKSFQVFPIATKRTNYNGLYCESQK